MKKLLMLILLCALVTVSWAQDTLKFSGVVSVSTQNSSMLTGGRFSDKPNLAGMFTGSYNNFSLSFVRSNDLIDSKSAANLIALVPSYSKSWGNYSMTAIFEVDLFDEVKEFNLVAPYAIISRKGKVDLSVLAGYATTLQDGNDIWLGRIGVGKTMYKTNFTLYAIYMDWYEKSYTVVGEVNRDIVKTIQLAMSYHLNGISSEKYQTFGNVKITYSF